MLKKWFTSRKWVAALLGALVAGFGHKIGLEPDQAEAASNCLLAAVGAEGVIDAMRAFRKGD